MRDAAVRIASLAHAGQYRRDGFTPYVIHPMRVANRVGNHHPNHPLLQVVALLHDVVEDSEDWTTHTLSETGLFPPEVVDAVDALTKRDGETYTDYLSRVNGDPLARIVKRYDIIDNLSDDPPRTMLRRYAVALDRLTQPHS